MAYGDGQTQLFQTLFRRSCQVALWVTVPTCALVALAGGSIMSTWTRAQVPMQWAPFLLLLAAAPINALWSTALTTAYSTNRHGRIAIAYVCIYGAGALALSYAGARLGGFTGVTLALLLVELPMAAYVMRVTLRMSSHTWRGWLHGVMSPPSFIFSAHRSQPAPRAD
jgi:O-antigen/teichoic acid export membrane protein